jgi:hypothetical protein
MEKSLAGILIRSILNLHLNSSYTIALSVVALAFITSGWHIFFSLFSLRRFRGLSIIIRIAIATLVYLLLLLLPLKILAIAAILAVLVVIVFWIRRERRERDRFSPESSSDTKIDLARLAQHVIIVDKDGIALKPHPHYESSYLFGLAPIFERMSRSDFAKYVNNILDKIAALPNKKIVFFVHGGLNNYRNALSLADKRLKEMEKDDFYPIFILWRSGLVPCYWEHLTEFRQGRTPLTSWYGRIFLLLANMLADLGRVISRYPKTVYYQVLSEYSAVRPSFESDGINMPNYYSVLRYIRNIADFSPFHIEKKGADSVDAMNTSDPKLLFELLSPLKLGFRYSVWPIIDALGSSAWDIIKRRANTLFHSPYEFDVKTRPSWSYTPDLDKEIRVPKCLEEEKAYVEMLFTRSSGALSIFIREFVKRNFRNEVVLVGHSAGTIVINHWLRLFPDFSCREIVYMAAACMIEDAVDAVVPYLKDKSTTVFYNLCLHPKAERIEQHTIGLSPTGSLLEWIDNYFSKPLTFDQRTLGKWDNVLQATHLFPESLRSRIHLKAFGIFSNQGLRSDEEAACPNGAPTEHGDFGQCKFWKEAFFTAQ